MEGTLLKIAIVSTEANGEKPLYGFRRLLMDRRQLVVNLATATFYQELTTSQIIEKSEKHKRRTPLQGQTRHNVRKTRRQDVDKVKVVELKIAVSIICHFAIGTVEHLSEIMIAHGHGSTLEHIKLHRSECACLIWAWEYTGAHKVT